MIVFVGQVRTGGIVSSTVNLCVASPKLPHSSVTRYTRVTVPGQRPTRPLSLVSEKVSVGLHASVAVPPAARNAARLAYAAGTLPTHWTAMVGQVMLGLRVSAPVLVCRTLLLLRH